MKRLISYLFLMSITLFMMSACQADRLNASKAPMAKKQNNKPNADDDCLDDNPKKLQSIVAIVAQGCPVNLD